MKPRHILLAGGLVIAAWLTLFGDKTPNADIAMPVTRSSAPAAPPSAMRSTTPAAAAMDEESLILAVLPRENLIGGMRNSDQPANLFASHSWTPPPPPPPAAAIVPTAPPLPFKYLGKQKEGDAWQVFLSRGDTTFIVQENDVIENLYKVQDIAPPSITLLYLPLNQTQSLTIE